MVSSMTAFARQAGQGEWADTIWELRSVNHRYLEISVRLPEELRGLEGPVRELVGNRIQRGKIDCVLRYSPSESATMAPVLRLELVRHLIEACERVNALLDRPAPVSAVELLRWPGVVALAAPDVEAIGEPLLRILEAALSALVEERRREGGRLRSVVEERCAAAATRLARLRERVPEIMTALRERLMKRVQELASGMEPGRLEQEMMLLAQRLDVAEELDRLEIHLDEVKSLFGNAAPIGRRLDFLLQEMNREANTIASKSVHAETTSNAVELKVLIEQMREQVQNIE